MLISMLPSVWRPVVMYVVDIQPRCEVIATGDHGALLDITDYSARKRLKKVAYFVHDLSDAAAGRRVQMLRAADTVVEVAGFRRGAQPRSTLSGVPALDLGETFDGAMTHRAMQVVREVGGVRRFARMTRGADLIIARNLEMLAIAAAARRKYAPKAALVYECLDIHRLMVGEGAASSALRWIERRLLESCTSIVVSAPAFAREHFHKRCRNLPPIHLVENKVLNLLGALQRRSSARPPGPPWRIGWFGILRCRKSVDLLKEIVRRGEGRIEVVIRGRPSPHTLPDLEQLIADAPGISFLGPYQLEDLPSLYADVHFAWSIDFMDEGANSDWLLPNRIYESGFFNTPAIAERGKAAGAWLADHHAGLLVDDIVDDASAQLLSLSPETYRAFVERVEAIDARDVSFERADGDAFVDLLLSSKRP